MGNLAENVEPIGVRLTVSALSREFGVSRETVNRRIDSAGVTPIGKTDKGHLTYKLKDSAMAILGVMSQRQNWEEVDPARLHPSDRAQLAKARLDETRKKLEDLKVDSAEGMLVSEGECREQMAVLKNAFVQMMDTLPDILERDCNLPPDAVGKLETICDHLRTKLAEELMH